MELLLFLALIPFALYGLYLVVAGLVIVGAVSLAIIAAIWKKLVAFQTKNKTIHSCAFAFALFSAASVA